MKKIIGVFILVFTAALFLTAFNPQETFAASTNETEATASVTVNQYIDVTLYNTTIEFGSLDPGATDTANSNNPLMVSVETTTNTQTNLTIKGTDFTDGGSNVIGIGNMTYYNESSVGDSISVQTTYPSPPPFENWINIPDPTTAQENRTIYFWINIPSSQPAASYSSTVTIKTGVFQ